VVRGQNGSGSSHGDGRGVRFACERIKFSGDLQGGLDLYGLKRREYQNLWPEGRSFLKKRAQGNGGRNLLPYSPLREKERAGVGESVTDNTRLVISPTEHFIEKKGGRCQCSLELSPIRRESDLS